MRQVLDLGYVKLVERWGSDEAIIEDDRMSTGKGFQGWEKDERLLRYLYEHKHTSPFEGSGMKIEVKLPIFVARQWKSHRTQSYSEMSLRYVEAPEEFYIPSVERLMHSKQGTKNKQGSEEGLSKIAADIIASYIVDTVGDARWLYEYMLREGVSREIARIVLPLNQYTRFRASANLHNWLNFLRLRLGEGVQWEMREYAKAVLELVQQEFPRTYELFSTLEFGGSV